MIDLNNIILLRKIFNLLLCALILTPLFASSTALAAVEITEEFTPYQYDDVFDEEFSGISDNGSKIIKDKITSIKVSEKEYLTDAEVMQTDISTLVLIHEKLIDDVISGNYSDDELNQMAAQEIKRNLNNVNLTSDYTIPGFGDLNSAEITLAKRHPIEFTNYAATAVNALNETSKYYGGSQLHQGNGDAFRHAYWNAIMVPYFGGSKGAENGYNRAKVWKDAHESTSSGIDKEMDLYNNEQGRYLGWINYTNTTSQFSSTLRQWVSRGTLVRIVNGKLVATNGVTGK